MQRLNIDYYELSPVLVFTLYLKVLALEGLVLLVMPVVLVQISVEFTGLNSFGLINHRLIQHLLVSEIKVLTCHLCSDYSLSL